MADPGCPILMQNTSAWNKTLQGLFSNTALKLLFLWLVLGI